MTDIDDLDLVRLLEALDESPIYLEVHKPARSQFRNPRRARPTGAIVVHTAENVARTEAIDGGAEAVARFIRSRETAGSYHTLVDSDSIVRLGRYIWEMYGEGTGGNQWALHLSIAAQAAKWRALPAEWVDKAITRAAVAAAHMAIWCHAEYGIVVPARTIREDDYRKGYAGFIAHASLDPGRRTDPGKHFPWETFLARYKAMYIQALGIDPDTAEPVTKPKKEPPVPHPDAYMAGRYDAAVRDVTALYDAYRPLSPITSEPSDYEARANEISEWAKDLARKMFVSGETPGPTLRFIQYELNRTSE